MTETQANAPPIPESTVARELAAGLIGAAIAAACVLPPLVHFVTGPLGPLIGGFVVSKHIRPGTRGRAIVAGTIGFGLAALVGAAAAAIMIGNPEGLPSWFPSTDAAAGIVAGIFAYGTLLGAAGTALAARAVDKAEHG